MRHSIKGIQVIAAAISLFQVTPAIAVEWERVPAPPRDFVYDVFPIHAHEEEIADTVYASTGEDLMMGIDGGGGVWMSTDGGLSWILVSGGPSGIPQDETLLSLDLDPQDHRHMVAGGMEGIYVSHDGGETFIVKHPGGNDFAVRGLLVHPQEPSVLFVGFDYGGLYRTPDEGETWEEKIFLHGAGRILEDPAITGSFYTVIQNGMYASTDHGITWERRAYFGFIDLAVEPVQPYAIFAATKSGVYLSDDQGWSWDRLGTYDSTAEAITVSGDSLILANLADSGLVRSTDRGMTWSDPDPLFSTALVQRIARDERTAGRFWIASQFAGLWVSDDEGASWREVTLGSDTCEVLSLAIPSWDPSSVVAGSSYRISRSRDLGTTWEMMSGGLQYHELLSLHPRDSLIALSGWNTNVEGAIVLHTDNGGKSWTYVLSESFSGIWDLAFHPLRPDTAFSSMYEHHYRSTDAGGSWQPFDSPCATGGKFAFDPFDPDRMFLYGGGYSGDLSICRSTDGSASWHEAKEGLPSNGNVVSMSASPSEPNTFFLAMTGTEGSVYRTGDGGSSWSLQGELGSGKGPIRSMLVHPRDRDIVYAVAATGVYLSRDGGVAWEDFSEGIDPGADLYTLAVDSVARGKVFVGGAPPYYASSLIYERDLEPVGIEEPRGETGTTLPAAFLLAQNYPNPFNPVTTIPFEVPPSEGARAHVNLAIRDVRGRLVVTLIDSDFEAGRHQVVWNGKNRNEENVASGIYFCVLRTSQRIFTRKMLMIN